jgi:hypothetical protein
MEIAIMQHEEIQHNMLVTDEKQEITLNPNAKKTRNHKPKTITLMNFGRGAGGC